ncbi:NADH-quinone oxidoreductase subunit NuoG [Acidimicrobiaceae bacterium]|nr:NADH-quinone oxidoreductase subunit NuoG [Acidimicrobiaceae bacterium]MDA9712810.1 NADH-quinone oxidoreductase subunit NuoG [Acidimicrobiaceae bacterium]
MKDHIKINVNGSEISSKPDQLIIEACEDSGIHIPRFCWHKRMDPVGMCRMCLVEIETPRGKALVPSCTTKVSEDLVVDTESDVVKKAQEGVLEFLLINHPLDCPVCDKAGECPLQDQTMAYGPGESRFVEDKRHFEKPIPISEIILLDRERCILCARCTRFSDEISGDPLIEFIQRGNKTQVNTFPDEPFRSYFSGNTVQICPVGALTSSSYRFKARPWDLKKVSSTSNCSSVGDSVELNVSQNKMLRILGEDNEFTNQGWLSDKGRYNFEYLHSDKRIETPILVKNSNKELTINETMELISNEILTSDNPNISFIVGHNSTNEEYYALNQFVGNLDKVENENTASNINFYLSDDYLYNGFFNDDYSLGEIKDLDSADTIILWAQDIKDNLPTLYLRIKQAVRNGKKLLIFGHTNTAIKQLSEEYYGENIVTNNFEFNVDLLDIPNLSNYIDGKNVLAIVGKASPLQNVNPIFQLVKHLDQNSNLKIINCFSKGNTLGALQNLDIVKGLNEFITEFDSSKKNIVFTVGSNPVNNSIYSNKIKETLIDSDFVVSLDLFKNETTELSDIILPTTTFGEKEGTFTNLEMRTLMQNKILPTPGSALNEWEYWLILSNKMNLLESYGTEAELNSMLCKDYIDNDNIPSFDNLNKPSNLDGILNSKTINIEVENIDSTNLEILFVHRLYGDSSSQINSPSISMLGSERFIEMNSATYFGSYMLNSDVVTLIQENNSIQVNVNINENLPDNLLVVPINRRGFQDLNPEKKVELEVAKNREQLSVT